MPALGRLLLSLGTLTVFWLTLLGPAASDRLGTAAAMTVVSPGDTMPPGSVATLTADAGSADAALDALITASHEAYTQERWQDALEPTRALVERFPSQHVYLGRLAWIYNGLGRPADEAATWEQFMEWAPIPGEACPAIGYAYRTLGRLDRALAAFERCLESDPLNAELTFFVGLGQEWNANLEKAREFYARANELSPPYDDGLVGLARVNLHLQHFETARKAATDVLAHAPDHVDALLVAGLAEQRSGHNREARVHLERAGRLSKDYFDVQLALGVLEFSESRLAAARTRFETAARLDPGRQGELRVWLDRTARAEANP